MIRCPDWSEHYLDKAVKGFECPDHVELPQLLKAVAMQHATPFHQREKCNLTRLAYHRSNS